MLYLEEREYSNCCGCSACYAICPKQAIVMQPNEKGFLYPIIDETKCINCGLCKKVCNSKYPPEYNTIAAYAAKHKDKEVLQKSSSGGICMAICEETLKKGNATVYGVAYDKDYHVVTCRAETIDDCKKFHGSKYVQTNPLDTMKEVASDLTEGKSVLYFGTPCFVTGLLSFLKLKKVDTSALLTCDIICHGVPSPKLFDEYIDFLRARGASAFYFRTKACGWGGGKCGTKIMYENGQVETESPLSNAFVKIYFSNNCSRTSCTTCEFVHNNKVADITLGDYHGIKIEHPEFFDINGVSAVITHTIKGDSFFRSIDSVKRIDSSVEKIFRKNARIPFERASSYEQFWKEYNKHGIKYILKKYGGLSFRVKIKKTIIKFLGRA